MKSRVGRFWLAVAGLFGVSIDPLKGQPMSSKFRFEHRFIDRELTGGSWAQTTLADYDGDGLPEFTVGQNGGPIYWYDYADGGWKRYLLGEQSPSDVGACALDVDGDGHLDFVAGGAWYRNPGDPRSGAFERIVFDPDLNSVHDILAADIDGDGKPEVLTMSDRNNLR